MSDPERPMTVSEWAVLEVMCRDAANNGLTTLRTEFYRALERKCLARKEALKQGRVIP